MDLTDVERAVLRAMDGRWGMRLAISRAELANEVELRLDQAEPLKDADRQVRRAIEHLRSSHSIGALIVSDPRWQGYWLATDLEDVKRFVTIKRRVAKKLFEDARAQIRLARQTYKEPVIYENGQMDMFR